MTFLASVKALPRPESRKFPVFSLLTGEFGFQRRVRSCLPPPAVSQQRTEERSRHLILGRRPRCDPRPHAPRHRPDPRRAAPRSKQAILAVGALSRLGEED